MNMPCACRVDCPGTDSPFANLTSEAPDRLIFIGYSWGLADNWPPLGFDFGDPINNPAFCESPVSQEEADLCAQRNQQNCLVGNCVDGTTTPSIPWRRRTGRQIHIFTNAAAFCTVQCPDGLPFTYTVRAGLFTATSQQAADDQAISYACSLAAKNVVCFGSFNGNACVNVAFLGVWNVTGGFPPYVIKIVNGTLPPGVGFVQDTPTTAFVSGQPTVTGNYTITMRANDTKGNFMQKDFTISVLGFTNPATITAGQVGVAYGYQFTYNGGTGPYTVSLVNGVIPAGMTLDTTGDLTGVPTTAESDNFTIQVTDSKGQSCTGNFTITINPSTGCVPDVGPAVPAAYNPAIQPVRIRIKNYNEALFTNMSTCPFDGVVIWDGTLPVKSAPNNFTLNYLPIGSSPFPAFSIHEVMIQLRGVLIQSFFDGVNGVWGLLINCNTAPLLWKGIKNVGLDPTGTYIKTGGSLTAPQCVIIESY